MNHNNGTGASPLQVEYPEDVEFIRVIFQPDGGVLIRPRLNPHGGTEVEGEPQTQLNALEIARLMDFAYGCGRNNLLEKMRQHQP